MCKLININSKDQKLTKSTKFAKIFNINDKYAIKTINTDYIILPHNHEYEISILLKLKLASKDHVLRNRCGGGADCIMELLDQRRIGDDVELLFPYYPQSLYEFMRSQYKPIAGSTERVKKNRNPYYDLMSPGISDEDEVEQMVKFVNCFDLNKYAYSFFFQMVQGLSFIHLNGIIHRDIKPQNIMLDPTTNMLKITDFGISYDSRDVKQTTKEPADKKITDISTSFYKAPEILFGVKNYSYGVDVWGLMILVSQWFQKETTIISTEGKIVSDSRDDFFIPAMIDDGSNDLESGSDIRLIMSLFEKFGVPKLSEWPQVEEFGSVDAFVGLFGETGDGKYIVNQEREVQESRITELLPRLEELTDDGMKLKFIDCFLKMIPFESTERISCVDLWELLKA